MPTPSYEIPSDMRDMAEKCVEQASRAFDGFMSAAQKAVGHADSGPGSIQSRGVGTKTMGFAETEVRSAFDLARKLVRAKDLQEILALQSDYAKSQMTVIQEQAKELGSLMQTSAGGMVQAMGGGTALEAEFGPSRTDFGLRTSPSANEAPQVDEAAFQPSARAVAMLRGVEIARRDLVDAGGTYTEIEVQDLLDIRSEQEIDDLVDGGSLLALKTPHQGRRFPVFQFDEQGSIIDGVGAVRKALHTGNVWAIMNFMTRPHRPLDDRRPIDLLKVGEVDLVVKAAMSVGVQGA